MISVDGIDSIGLVVVIKVILLAASLSEKMGEVVVFTVRKLRAMPSRMNPAFKGCLSSRSKSVFINLKGVLIVEIRVCSIAVFFANS